MESNGQWFRRGLATRVDALQLALKALSAGDAHATSTIKHVARSLLEPAANYGFPSICECARKVEHSSKDKLPETVGRMIAVLREEVAKVDTPSRTVMVVGGSKAFAEELRQSLSGQNLNLIHAEKGQEALAGLTKQDVVLTILHLMLPDMDGRKLLRRLRSNPKSSAIPVLVLGEKLSQAAQPGDMAFDANGFIEGPQDVHQVRSWIAARLRRAHETVKEARRDGLTGLMNRASFLDALARADDACRASQEPLAVALLSVDGLGEVTKQHGTHKRDEIIQRVSSLLSTSLRTTDVLARWSPDEFVAVFPAEDQFGGTSAVKKIIDRLESERFHGPAGEPFRVTLSAGVSVAHGRVGREDALSEADRYLFEAKSSGGGHVVCSRSAIPHPPRRVLIVHDEDTTLRVVKNLLEKDEFLVTHVRNPEAAVNESQRFHLMLVSEHLAGSDGFRVLSELRAQSRNARVPIVMLLSANDESSMVKALHMGASDYLTRPFDPFSFMAHMRRLVSRGPSPEPDVEGPEGILIVDSDPQALIVAASALHQRGGPPPYLATGLKDAMKRVALHKPQAMLIPVSMVRRHPTEVDKLLKAADITEACVVLCASEDESASEHVKDLTARGFRGPLLKPLDPLTCAEALLDILGLKRSGASRTGMSEHLQKEIKRLKRNSD